MTTVQLLSILGVAWSTVVALIGTGLRLIMSGGLVPRAQVDAMTRQWEARLNESHTRERDWMAAAQAGAATNAEYAEQFGQLLPVARTTEALVRALPTGQDRQ